MFDGNKVACYSRVSSALQTTENKVLVLKEWSARNCEGEPRFFEESESTWNTRPVKESIIGLMRSGEINTIVVVALDRWCRSTSEFARELGEFKAKGIGFYSLREGFNFDSAMGVAMAQITMVFAQLERDLIRERTIAGLKRARAQGKTLGRPFGSKKKKRRRLKSV